MKSKFLMSVATIAIVSFSASAALACIGTNCSELDSSGFVNSLSNQTMFDELKSTSNTVVAYGGGNQWLSGKARSISNTNIKLEMYLGQEASYEQEVTLPKGNVSFFGSSRMEVEAGLQTDRRCPTGTLDVSAYRSNFAGVSILDNKASAYLGTASGLNAKVIGKNPVLNANLNTLDAYQAVTASGNTMVGITKTATQTSAR